MKALLLGSGIASGVPGWNDGSELALRARGGDPDVPRRAGAALAVSADGVRHAILEAPFALAGLLTARPRFAPPTGRRAVPIDGLVLTSADLDACAGAIALRSGLAARIVSPHPLREALVAHDAGFASLAPVWTGLDWDRPFVLDREEQLEARLFPLPGPPPDHLRADAERLEPPPDETRPSHRPDGGRDRAAAGPEARGLRAGRARCGVRITDRRSGARLVWAPRITAYDSATLAELRAADVRLVDGTCLDDDGARGVRPGARSAVDLGHAPVDGRAGSLVQLAGMGGRSIYVHLAGSNPLCDARSKEAQRVREAGVEIGHDGLELTL